MFFIAYAIKGQVHGFAGRVKMVSHSSEIFLSPEQVPYRNQLIVENKSLGINVIRTKDKR